MTSMNPMNTVGPFVGLIDKYLFDPVVNTIKKLIRSSDKLKKLQEKVDQLTAASRDKQHKLTEAEKAGQVMTDTAINWFENVRKIIEEATDVEESYRQRTCAGGLCVNCCSLYNLSNTCVELTGKADEKLKEEFELARRPIENQPSTQGKLHQILDYIRDPDPHNGLIRVYGKGGVGKTTLAKEVYNYFKDNSSFEAVIMVTVSATPNIRSIRIIIGERLGLNLSNEREADAKEKLSKALREKKFLLILDDVGEENKLMLSDEGILRHEYNERSSKILLISRPQEACADVDAEIKIEVHPLPVDESLKLFVEIAGQHVAANLLIRSLAEQIVRSCEGLPLGIVAVAKAMSNQRGVGEWEKAVKDMEELARDFKGTEEEILAPLKFCFDRLENNLLRSLFLYCACFPEGFNIEKRQILDFCVGEGLIDSLGSLTDAISEGEDMIRKLKNASMLEDGEVEGSVKMHDKMRQFARWITSAESGSTWSKFLVSTGKPFKEAPVANEWVDAIRISLMDTQIEELPKLRQRCGKLTTLLLGHSKIHAIPTKDFVSFLVSLRVLDLSDALTLKNLPKSLSPLVNLRVLRLRECPFLQILPELRKLGHLQVLDLRNCKFSKQQNLRSECLEGVSDLRYLDVSLSNVSIPAGVISSVLKSVEVLNLHEAHNIKWRVMLSSENQSNSHSDDHNEGQSMVAENNVIDVGELFKLTHLTSLGISFQSINISDWFIPLAHKITHLELNSCTVVEVAIRALNGSQYLQQLQFASCQDLKWVPTCVEEKLEIENCEDLEKVLDGAEVESNQDSFQRLNVLCLRLLKNLEVICVGPAPPNCFGNLRKITITRCPRLKMVFTKEMFFVEGTPRLFNNLESIMVNHCEKMEVIIEGEEMKGSKNKGRVISPFPKLKTLHLSELPVLAHVCSNSILQCPRLKCMTAHNCSKLKKDPLHISIADELLVIKNEETGQWEGDVLDQEIQD